MTRSRSFTKIGATLMGGSLPGDWRVVALAGALWLGMNASVAEAQSRDDMIQEHVIAIETSGETPLDELSRNFDRERYSSSFIERTSSTERRGLLDEIRQATQADDVTLDQDGDQFVLSFADESSVVQVVFNIEPRPPFKIDALRVERGSAVQTLQITATNIDDVLSDMERAGISGALYIRIGRDVVANRGFGMANASLQIANRPDTVFGIGSRPIDFTTAAILLLAQRGALDLDDAIGRHFSNVPRDKRGITIRHLLEGRSGLPDFFHDETDWDADLAWIDRREAERRLFAQPLLFPPGSAHAHSHGAFGLLAALVERVSGQSYVEFVRSNLIAPAGMTRTGFNGENHGLALHDFAVGGGPSVVGLPNIPPNWGPTSWLIMGSGGMYSTLDDLRRFYALVRGDLFEPEYAVWFREASGDADGSDRGFELVSEYDPERDREAYLVINSELGRPESRLLARAVVRFVTGQ